MDIELLFTVILTATIQSLFGVGILLFGTPILLLLDYSFIESILILLPISASINILQIIKDYKYINRKIYKNILLITIPFVIISLILVSSNQYNVSLFIGIVLIFIALKDYIGILSNLLNRLMKFEKLYYIIMGVVHGLTNLGGALLTAKVFHSKLDKYEKRATIAMSYMTFALFQIGTLFFLDTQYELKNILYIIIGVAVYFLVNRLFHNITEYKYEKLFSIFLLFTAILLIVK